MSTPDTSSPHRLTLLACLRLYPERHPGTGKADDFDLHRLLSEASQHNGYTIRLCYRALRFVATGTPEPAPPGLGPAWWLRLSREGQLALLESAAHAPGDSLGIPLTPPAEGSGPDEETP